MNRSSNDKISRRIKGEGTIRKRGNSYEGRVTVNVNGKSKQISVYGKSQRIVIEKMQELRRKKDDNYFIAHNKYITFMMNRYEIIDKKSSYDEIRKNILKAIQKIII